MKKELHTILSSHITAPLLLLTASVVALTSALVAQYGFDLQPCSLCLFERVPYAIVFFLAATALYCAKRMPKVTAILCGIAALLMLFESGLAIYHVGVEQGIFDDPSTCSAAVDTTDIDALRASIFSTPTVSCSDVAFELFGISMAGWNALYALGLAVFVFADLFFQRGSYKQGA